MSAAPAEVVICGAGMAGVAAAYHLAVRRGIGGVVLVDERPALSLTSDKSAESYRNWWPGPGDSMVALMNRSIDLMEELARESGNVFLMNRRGYLFATAQPEQVDRYVRAAEDAAGLRGRTCSHASLLRGHVSARARRRLRAAAHRDRRHHRTEPDPSPLPLPGLGHGGAAARAALRLVQRPAARDVHARARAGQGRAPGRGARGARGDDGRAGDRGGGERARRHAHDRDAALRQRGGALPQGRGAAARRRAARVLRAARQGRVPRHAGRGAAPRADDDLDGSGAAAVVGRRARGARRGRGAPAPAGGDARRRARAARGRGRQPDHARRLDLPRRADGGARSRSSSIRPTRRSWSAA